MYEKISQFTIVTRDLNRFYTWQLRDTICKFVLQIDDNMHCSNF